jgi:hypothetical protein
MRIRLSLAVMWTILILVLCWIPGDWLPVKETGESTWEIPYKDKFVHAGMFFVFAHLWLEASPRRQGRFVWVALAGLALAAVTELGQNIPVLKRDGEFADAFADFTGVMVGLLLFRWFDSWRERWQPIGARGNRDAED